MTLRQGHKKILDMLCGLATIALVLFGTGEVASPGERVDMPETQQNAGVGSVETGVTALAADTEGEMSKEVLALIAPEKQQPYWFMPFSGMIIVIATMTVFGFPIRFKEPKKEPNQIIARMSWTMSKVSTLAFIAMAVNCWRQDWKKLSDVREVSTKLSETLLALPVIMVTSSNFKAALVMWYKIQQSNPGALFGATPQYPVIAWSFPVNPMQTSWMPPLKWLYSVLLLPYYLPFSVIYATLSCVFTFTKCCILCGLCKICCCCYLWTFLVVISLGFWGGARESFATYWHDYYPFAYIIYLTVWSIGLLVLSSVAYKIIIEQTTPTQPEGSRKVSLWSIQKDELKNDFKKDGTVGSTSTLPKFGYVTYIIMAETGCGIPESEKQNEPDSPLLEAPGNENCPKWVDSNEVSAMKVGIVFQLMALQATMYLQQMGVIYMCRTILGQEYIEAVRATVDERTIKSYIQYTMSEAREYGGKGFGYFMLFWNALA